MLTVRKSKQPAKVVVVVSSVSASKHQLPAREKSALLESTEITSFTDNCSKSSLMNFLFVAFVVSIFVFLTKVFTARCTSQLSLDQHSANYLVLSKERNLVKPSNFIVCVKYWPFFSSLKNKNPTGHYTSNATATARMGDSRQAAAITIIFAAVGLYLC